jgi:hypothetical protein
VGWRMVVTYAVDGWCGGLVGISGAERVAFDVRWWCRGKAGRQAAKLFKDPAPATKRVTLSPQKTQQIVLSLTQDLLPPPRSLSRPQGEQMKVK